MENPSVRRAAVVSISGRRILAVECEVREGLAQLERSLDWAKFDQVIAVNRLPVDKRHHAKIDYGRLKNEISKKIPAHPKL